MTEPRLPSSPYKGLIPFSEEDAPFFFGRESESRIISANLRTRRLTLLYGPTAVGKSSVLRAGVVYNLRKLTSQLQLADFDSLGHVFNAERFNLARDYSQLEIPSSVLGGQQSRVIVVVFSKWVEDPLIPLRETILSDLKQSLPDIFTIETNQELRVLSLGEMLKQITRHREVAELLIILDQFEEYFVYHPDDEGYGKFADEFSAVMSYLDLRVNFLISIREDWLARLDRFKGRIPNLFDNSIRINHLDRSAAQDAVEKPIEKYNEIVRELSAEGDVAPQQVLIEDSFTAEVLNQLEKLDEGEEISQKSSSLPSEPRSGEGRILTSRLQIVMLYLWDKVKTATPPKFEFQLLQEKDTVVRIIKSHLRQTLDQLGRKEKLIAADFFRFMITTSGTKLAESAETLADRSGRPVQRIQLVLDKLSQPDFKILNKISPPPNQPNQLRYELTSDALAAPILEWVKDIRSRQHQKKTQIKYLIAFIVALTIVTAAAVYKKSLDKERAANEQGQVLREERALTQSKLDDLQRLENQIPYSRAVLHHRRRLTTAVFTKDGRVLTASADGSAILWDVDAKKEIQKFIYSGKPLVCAAISPDGNRVVTADLDGLVMLWTVGSTAFSELRGPSQYHITDISFSPSGDQIAAADTVGRVIVWNTASGEVVREEPGSGQAVRRIAFSPSGKLLAAGSDDTTVRVWQVDNWSAVHTLKGHLERINSVAFSPNEKFLATASADATVRIWDLSSGTAIRVLRGHTKSINSVDYNDDGQQLVTASEDTTALVWMIDTSKSIASIGHTDEVISASFSPSASSNSQQVVTASKDGVVSISSAITGKSFVDLRGHNSKVTYVAYSEDGKYVLTASDDFTARVWFANEPEQLRIDQPSIVASPNYHPGDCPVTISFLVKITALSGKGAISYRFERSDGRSWPPKTLEFDGPGTKYINRYWLVTADYSGSEKIEILEPKGVPSQAAKFTVKCKESETPSPEPAPTATP
jgi:WD40 repeat protein